MDTSLLALLGLGIESQAGRVVGNHDMSIGAVIYLVALPLLGAVGVLIVAAVSVGLATGQKILPRLFNTASTTLHALAAVFTYWLAGGMSPIPSGVSANELMYRVLVPLMLAAGVQLLVNIMLLSGILALYERRSWRLTFREVLVNAAAPYPGYAAVAFVLAVLWRPAGLGALSILPIVAPLLLAQWSVHLREEENVVHLRTVETLVAAAQAGQPALRGRSAWVEVVSRELGMELHLSASQAEALRYAALLHDIGLVAPAEHATGERLNAREMAWIRSHPDQGVRMLEGVDFLAEAVHAVGFHHERWDGAGYPHGVAATDIPMLARILAVADAYCAIVAADPEVMHGDLAAIGERSVQQVLDLAGTQLDPVCTRALEQAHPRILEALARCIEEEPPRPVTGVDPHLPWVSEMFAVRTAT